MQVATRFLAQQTRVKLEHALVIAPLIAMSTILSMSTTGLLFAEGIDPGVGNMLGSIFGNLGIMGVLGWYLWYHTSVSQPKMIEKFATQLDAERKEHSEELDQLRVAFDRQLDKQQVAHDREMKEMRDHAARENAKLQEALITALQGMRTAVHEVKDTAQTAIVEAARIETKRDRAGDSKHG